MSNLQDNVGSWMRENFTAGFEPIGLVKKTKEELRELRLNPMDDEEAGDVLITLLGVAEAAGYDLIDAAKRKMAINRERTWAKNPDGSYSHVKSTEPTEMETLRKQLERVQGYQMDVVDLIESIDHYTRKLPEGPVRGDLEESLRGLNTSLMCLLIAVGSAEDDIVLAGRP